MSYEIIHKSTFTNQLLALPSRELPHVLEKVRLLEDAPAPDAKNKKRLQGYAGAVYRIRAGDYRILYTFDEQNGWVALLGVDNRKDVYRGEQLVAEAPTFDVASVPGAADLLAPAQQGWTQLPPQEARRSSEDYLPVRLDAEFLKHLRVPDVFLPALLRCETVDDLTNADIPEAVRGRVFDTVMDPDYDRVLQQPSFVTGDVDDLLKFAEGELLGFLLKLNPEQERFVTWAINAGGPTLIKGGPGTGKSTVALHRVRALIDALRAAGNPQPRILFTTYTNALVSFSQQLLQRLLGDDAACVRVRTADDQAWRTVGRVDGRPHVARSSELREALKEAQRTALFEGNALQRRAQARTIEQLSPSYLLEELLSVIEARELATLEDYLATSRGARRVSLNATQRTAIWRVYEAFVRTLRRYGVHTWQSLRHRAADLAREGQAGHRFDGVIIDEAQDLDASVLRMLVALCRAPNRLFVAADANQSIYGSGFRWTDVHADLRFTGCTGILHANHRSTREIGEAAHSYLREGALDDETATVERVYVASGPQPSVRAVAQAYDETVLLARFLHGAAREFRLGVGACAVLVPSENTGRTIAGRLKDAGVEATFMPGRELDLERQATKVITMKSAKGLEFPIVAIAGLVDGPIPGAARGMEAEEAAEANERERRTIYVAMTRAMRALLVVLPEGKSSPLLSGFDGVRREIARLTLEKLLSDGRIHPARIEEAYERARSEIDQHVAEVGERAVHEADLGSLHPELTRLLGRLHYRTSYGQNVLAHSLECAHLAGLLAAELGASPPTAARAALLHDIGKAVSHEVDGPHALVGGQLARRHGESEAVAHAMESHHNEVDPKTVEAVIVQVVDSLSGARPGARGESLERYVTRLHDLEAVACMA
jgi:putative nucleotidyltransferase with HDIG domain